MAQLIAGSVAGSLTVAYLALVLIVGVAAPVSIVYGAVVFIVGTWSHFSG